MPGQSIILFDGVCNLCNGLVQFVIKRDKHKTFLFGSLQSEKAQALLAAHRSQKIDFTTVILLDGDSLCTESDAILRIVRQIGGVWVIFYVFKVVPKPLRDSMYKFVSRHRYKVFGRRDACMVPTPEFQDRFL